MSPITCATINALSLNMRCKYVSIEIYQLFMQCI
jgi:hypothetical protein